LLSNTKPEEAGFFWLYTIPISELVSELTLGGHRWASWLYAGQFACLFQDFLDSLGKRE